MKPTVLLIAGLFFISLCFSCASYSQCYESKTRFLFSKTEKGEQSLATLALYEQEADNSRVELTSPLVPAIIIRGEAKTEEGKLVVLITGVDLFANWPNGWTEAYYEASGKLVLKPADQNWQCLVEDPLELWDIINGEIRYFDNYYRNDDGLRKVRNRVERINQVSRFLKQEKQFPPLIGHLERSSVYGPSFQEQVIPFLFPETVDFSRLEREKQLDQAYYQKAQEDQQLVVWGADLPWRKDYTEAVFPEYLWELRNKGGIWRDYEEAGMLFFSLYNLPHFFNNVLNYTEFIQKE
jgi:hypothetical protein